MTGATTAAYPNGYTCTYPSAGTYTIRVKDNNGDKKGFTRIRFYINSTTQTDALKLIRMEQWGTAKWSSMERAYRGAANMEVNASDKPDLSGVGSMKEMFYYCSSADPDVSGWDVSTITNMSALFRGMIIANPDVSQWNVSSVTNFSYMFAETSNANPDLSGWDTSSAKYMNHMFYNATAANPDVSQWDVSKVTTFYAMFKKASSTDPNVSGWDTSSATDFGYMFYNATAANPDVSAWDTSSVTNLSYICSTVRVSPTPTSDNGMSPMSPT